jgi:hypothetical protein
MIGNQSLTELLLIQSPKLVEMTGNLNDILMKFIPAVFTLAVVVEYFNGMNWGTLVKRLFISTCILVFYTSVHIAFIEGAITISEKGILSDTHGKVDATYFKMSKKDMRNIKEVKKRELKRVKDEGSLSKRLLTKFNVVPKGALYISILFRKWFENLADRTLPDFTTIFVWIAFLAVKLLFSAVYHMTYVFAGVVAMLYLFEFGAKSLTGMLISTVWCMVMPMVVCASIFFLRESIGGVATSGGGLGNIALVIVSSAFFLFTPYITLKLIQGGGVASGIAQFGNMLAAGALYLGGGAVLSMATSKLKSGKSLISSSADRIMGSQDTTLGQAASQGLGRGGGFLSSGLSNSEKMILGADRILRPFATGKKNRAVKRSAQRFMNEEGYSPDAVVNFNGGEKIDSRLPLANRVNQAGVGVRPVEPEVKDAYGNTLKQDGSTLSNKRFSRKANTSGRKDPYGVPISESTVSLKNPYGVLESPTGTVRSSRRAKRFKKSVYTKEEIKNRKEKASFSERNGNSFGMDVIDQEIARSMDNSDGKEKPKSGNNVDNWGKL